jgi:imidazolonepropionase-like amidohydrolase
MRRMTIRKHGIAGNLVFFLLCISLMTRAQETFPVNGVAEPNVKAYAFTNATIIKDGGTTLKNATLVIREGKIVAVGTGITIPVDAQTIDCKGKYIYPSFIDVYSDYGMPALQRATGGFNFSAPAQLTTNTKGAYAWNQALKSEVEAVKVFTANEAQAKLLRDQGFGTVLTHQKDGIARGTGMVVTLSDEKENLAILKEKASSHYSFSKGTSTQSYPGSLMGSIALLRQTYLDAQWYQSKPAKEGLNLSLQSWNENQSLPQVFEANDKWNAVRCDRIAKEFGVRYIIKGGGNEYQRIKEMAATNAAFILPLNFPQAVDVDDPNDVRFISLSTMKHWEMAPSNPAAFEKANISFSLTAADLRDLKEFLPSVRKAIEYGLSESKAFEALTRTPATLAGIYDKVGSLETGKLANFFITNAPVFNDNAVIIQNWVQGQKYSVKEDAWSDVKGSYQLTINSPKGKLNYTVDVKSATTANVIGKDTVQGKLSYDGKLVRLSFPESKRSRNTFRLSGVATGDTWNGTGEDSSGVRFLWSAVHQKVAERADTIRKKETPRYGNVTFPFNGYGWEIQPKQETILIRNATVWTSDSEGKLEGTDVLIRNGKIAQVGKNLSASGARVIDASGKHVTPGIIDEHSHIAAASINEGGQSVSAEVRIKDNLDPEDIDIYRQLSGGVTTSHILHGSANTIGGQTQLIKLRWGANDQDLMFENADGFIKFALGENVKRTTAVNNNRFPDTRMGVEQVLMDAFQRAKDYETAMKEADAASKKKGNAPSAFRRDLELDALVEIMNNKRFITCHSYVQSEITAMLRVAEKFGFRVNTFTHILEGYKVADKMKAHGASASTFSDWWAYKNEVMDAIPYNAVLMQRVGMNVAINSDDGEMARRLNQEAAKSIKYGGMSEEDALKMVTINPAKMLHVDNRVGSIKAGKDGDVVVWSDHPLSIYAKAEKTIVDGIVYFDRDKDLELRKRLAAERNRIVQKMAGEKKSGGPTQPAQATMKVVHTCEDHLHRHGILEVDGDLINQ